VRAALVPIALVVAVVAGLATGVPSSTRRPGGGDAVLAVLAAELVAASLDLDVLAELVAIALVAAVVAEHVTGVPSSELGLNSVRPW